MRINCEVQVSNRKLPSLSLNNKRGGTRSSLGIGRPPASKADVSNLFIHLCTAQNKQGTKYKVGGNIEAVFTKFVSEGKFTIRFKTPEHDLCVKADPILAKSFLHILKLGIQNKDIENLHLSSLAPVKQSQVEKPKTKLVISSKQEYPITTAFPYTLENLRVNSVELNRVENRMCKLRKLQILHLGDNLIRELPDALGQMKCLSELHLPSNALTRISPHLFSGPLCHTLHLLDLSDNKIELLPHTLGQLHTLTYLKLDKNLLTNLPVSLGKLTKLRSLSASNNKLVDLPATASHLQLDTLDVYGNPFSATLGVVDSGTLEEVPSLRELLAVSCIERGLRPTAAEIPATLVTYLGSWLKCPCGKICFESHILAHIQLDLKRVSLSITLADPFHTSVPALATLCSRKCKEKLCKR
ncbi:hypothetical protein Pmani_019309 [Petrolisthes manimaculis]|uniref:PIF1/LRR1 pleckstrin homology domain-containing protein n=1 Tax=Petrolisthes manimaculis TaxID=1843537 RepID=A0AAE1U7J7_9EUCA|nr:hypothetical protein Pmani_019309 [Petrolisthes manimaculis]